MQANEPGGDISAKDSFNVNLIHLTERETNPIQFWEFLDT